MILWLIWRVGYWLEQMTSLQQVNSFFSLRYFTCFEAKQFSFCWSFPAKRKLLWWIVWDDMQTVEYGTEFDFKNRWNSSSSVV